MRRITESLAGMSITVRLLLWFLAISLVPCVLLTAVLEYLASHALEKAVKGRLMHVSQTKSSEIDSYVRERRKDADAAGRSPLVADSLVTLGTLLGRGPGDAPEFIAEVKKRRKLMTAFKDQRGYDNVFLFDPEGKTLFSLVDGLDVGPNLLDGPLKGSELADSFKRANTLLQSAVADFQVYPGVAHPLSFATNVVLDEKGVVVGLISLQLGNQQIYEIIRGSDGLGATGETVVGMIVGDEVVIVAPTRFDDQAAFRRKYQAGNPEMMALQRGARGQRGFGEALDYRAERVMAVWSYVPSLRWGLVVKQDYGEAYEQITRQRQVIGGLFVVTILLVVPVALLVARSLSRPIVAASEVAAKVASGDLTARLDIKAKGEVGKLVRAIRTMTDDLRTLIGKIQRSSISLMSTATEIAATSRQQQQAMHEYSTSTNEAAAAVKQISATSQELLRTMDEVNRVAGETAHMAADGQHGLAGMGKTMRILADSTTSIGSKLSVISERAANINLVVTTITKVADQTNLLSINAAIEAEKAGEYGLGFLVVAREIRRLADQTAVSTLDIERMVKEMQYSVSAGVMEMDKFSDQVRQGVTEVGHLSGQLGQIITAVQGLTERFDQVTEGMRVQATGADQIREAVVHLSDGIGQTVTTLHEFHQATAQLREAVGGLKDEVSRFQVDAAPLGAGN